jgi:arylformamidase
MRRIVLSVCLAALTAATLPSYAGTFLDNIKQRLQERRAAQDPDLAVPNGEADAATKRQPSLRDVPYGPDPLQRMDVYLPNAFLPRANAQVNGDGAATRKAPVIFMVHGGGWRHGDKASSAVVDNKAAHWLARGYVFISVNNRLLPQANPLEQARDVAQALAAAQAKASGWDADPTQFILMGHSAGAHLVALVHASPELVAEAGARPWLGTVALDTAAVDVSPIMEGQHFRLYDAAFGTDPAFWRAMSPTQQLTAGAKPILLVCSTRRDESCKQADTMASRGTQLGVRVQVLRQDLSHRDINQQLGLPGAYTDAVDAFIGSLVGPAATNP